jgi:hypothetical protein
MITKHSKGVDGFELIRDKLITYSSNYGVIQYNYPDLSNETIIFQTNNTDLSKQYNIIYDI